MKGYEYFCEGAIALYTNTVVKMLYKLEYRYN